MPVATIHRKAGAALWRRASRPPSAAAVSRLTHGAPARQPPPQPERSNALHAESVRLTDFHAAPMCTPSRGQLLTGLDAARNGDTIELADGVYTGPGNRDVDLLGKPLVIRSASDDATACIIDCEAGADGSHRGFLVGAEAAVIGRRRLQVPRLQATPQRVLVFLAAKRRAHDMRGRNLEVGMAVHRVVDQQVPG